MTQNLRFLFIFVLLAAFLFSLHVSNAQSRTINIISSPLILSSINPNTLANAILNSDALQFLTNAAFSGADVQAAVFSQNLQGFPTDSGSFLLLSSGVAAQAPGTASVFVSSSVGGGTGTSPDGLLAFDVATLTLTLNIPTDAQTLAFDFKFGTEENPTFLGSGFQDFFTAKINNTTNIALLSNGNTVTVDHADQFSNDVTGDSGVPTGEFPSSNDVVYNAVLRDMQTASFDLIPHRGQSITITFQIGDASDSALDSAVFIDNLRINRRPILDVPLFLQTDSRWAGDKYDLTVPTSTINALGCALSLAAMVLQFHGVTTTPDTFEETNPETLNRWLSEEENKGYTASGTLDWWKLSTYSNNRIKYLEAIDVGSGFTEQQARQKIDTDLASGAPVIIKTQYTNQVTGATTTHFVVAKGKVNNTYAINDPLSSTTQRLIDRNYQILGIRRIEKSAGTPISRLNISGLSPIQLLITDPQGRKSGFIGSIGQVVFEIPNSSYYEDEIDDDSDGFAKAGPVKILDIISPINGQYQLEVIGESLGTYALGIDAADITGAFRETSIAGLTATNTVSVFTINFSNATGSLPVIERNATIESAKDDILSARKLNFIDNDGIAKSFIQKLDAADKKIKRGDFKTAQNILNAFKNEIEAQRGKRINTNTALILLEDINSILEFISGTLTIETVNQSNTIDLTSLLAGLQAVLATLSQLLQNLLGLAQ